MKKYYDPEYDRIVDESVPKKQYEWFAAQKWFHKTYEEFLADNFLNEDMTKITAVAEYTEEQFQEVKTAMKSLGYPETKYIEFEAIDQVRCKVIYSGHLTIGIYDFSRHTFVD